MAPLHYAAKFADLVHDEVGPHVGPCTPVVEPNDLLVVVHAKPVQDGLGELVGAGAVDHREEVPDQTLAPVVLNSSVNFY